MTCLLIKQTEQFAPAFNILIVIYIVAGAVPFIPPYVYVPIFSDNLLLFCLVLLNLQS